MQTSTEDRRISQPELPEGMIRRHDTSSLVRAALRMQREAGTDKAIAFLHTSGVPEDVATRVLQQGQVREEDLNH